MRGRASPARALVGRPEREARRAVDEARAARVETRARLRARLFDAGRSGSRGRDAGRGAARPRRRRSRAVAAADPLLAPSARAGGRGLGADARRGGRRAIGALRVAGVPAESLARVARLAEDERGEGALGADHAPRGSEAPSARARGCCWVRCGARRRPRRAWPHRSARRAGRSSRDRDRGASPPAWVATALGASAVAARFVLEWDGADAAWWRALDAALARAGTGANGARAELPSFDEGLDASRARGPLDVVIDDVARALDAAPVIIAIGAPALGDLRLARSAPSRAARTSSRARPPTRKRRRGRCSTPCAAHSRGDAAAVDAIAIGAARLDDAAIAALRARVRRRARAAPRRRAAKRRRRPAWSPSPSERSPSAKRALERTAVAALARSSYVDAARLGADPDALSDLAYALERTPTAAASDRSAALGETARASSGARGHGRRGDPEARDARAPASPDIALPGGSRSMTRLEHVAAARSPSSWRWGSIRCARASAADALASDEPPREDSRGPSSTPSLATLTRGSCSTRRSLDFTRRPSRGLGSARSVVDSARVPPRALCALEARRGGLRRRAPAPSGSRSWGSWLAEKLALLVVIDANDGALPSRGDGGSCSSTRRSPRRFARSTRCARRRRRPFARRASLTALALAASERAKSRLHAPRARRGRRLHRPFAGRRVARARRAWRSVVVARLAARRPARHGARSSPAPPRARRTQAGGERATAVGDRARARVPLRARVGPGGPDPRRPRRLGRRSRRADAMRSQRRPVGAIARSP